MNTSLTTQDGRLTLQVNYDPLKLSLEEALSAAHAAYGLKPHQVVVVIAIPTRAVVDHGDAQGEAA